MIIGVLHHMLPHLSGVPHLLVNRPLQLDLRTRATVMTNTSYVTFILLELLLFSFVDNCNVRIAYNNGKNYFKLSFST